jgi:hypothetical protein
MLPLVLILPGVLQMRKRRAARPQLECMEIRQVPSGLNLASLAAQVAKASPASIQAHPDRQKAGAHAPKSHAAARQHHAVKHANLHNSHQSNSGSNQKNFFSNFFHSIFGV